MSSITEINVDDSIEGEAMDAVNEPEKNNSSEKAHAVKKLEARRKVEDKLEELRLKRESREFDLDFD